MTAQRKVIFEVIQGSMEHLTAEEIYLKAKKLYPTLAVGTVYRNLKLMAEAGEILHIRTPDGADRYDKTVTVHDHMECTQCGIFFDIPTHDILELLREQTGMRVTDYQLNVRGICPKCLKENQQ